MQRVLFMAQAVLQFFVALGALVVGAMFGLAETTLAFFIDRQLRP